MKNILIVGNGFDLSHFLPTKYDHFMGVMRAIQEFNKSNSCMSFDDLFSELQKKEPIFFSKTREFYNLEQVNLSSSKVDVFKDMLGKNVWYKFFLDHVNDIKTWIDFEQKIEEALLYIAGALQEIEDKFLKIGTFNVDIHLKSSGPASERSYVFSQLQFKILTQLTLFKQNQPIQNKTFIGKINPYYFNVALDESYGFNYKKYLSFLQTELDIFIEIFNKYLVLIVDKFCVSSLMQISGFSYIHKIYSFNYTNTFKKFHNQHANLEYLHGKHGDNQNIVLGISDLTIQSLVQLKAYGFTKYHQKLFKNTDYIFLSNILRDINSSLEKIKSLEQKIAHYQEGTRMRNELIKTIQLHQDYLDKTKYHLHLWGHSLDVSDQNYIHEIFSLNSDTYDSALVTIYYYNEDSKFELLANLIHILSKETVEKWVKNKWLEFMKNPEISLVKEQVEIVN